MVFHLSVFVTNYKEQDVNFVTKIERDSLHSFLSILLLKGWIPSMLIKEKIQNLFQGRQEEIMLINLRQSQHNCV